MNDIDLVIGVQAFPFLDELLGDVDHHGVIRLHRAAAERLKQNIVCLAPVRFGRIGSEQTVTTNRSHAA